MERSEKFRDKILICVDCNEEFVFTIAAQEYFAARNFTEDPKRCKDCYMELKRRRRKRGKEDDPDGGLTVWEPKLPPGFVPPTHGAIWIFPETDHDQEI